MRLLQQDEKSPTTATTMEMRDEVSGEAIC